MGEFRTSIKRLIEFKEKICQFKNKKKAMKATKLSKEECIEAYDFAMKIDFEKINDK